MIAAWGPAALALVVVALLVAVLRRLTADDRHYARTTKGRSS
ncbi:hypothetical protein [Promicromonospora iranensis]|uniref:Secreted protein with PEP-CTERM sorting signal n=1 Tax=Promicromonospora iranensis TaxID=1105144 RepID=A0ABU2CV82_9MICO|nr:hypothetical protein [Promicromonospora iranensis]MDR7385250.1 hypothetical protein [Promicromonospora iranensis]